MSLESEHRALRTSAAVTVLRDVALVRISAGDWDRADGIIASSLAVRDGQIRQGLIADEAERVIADVYLGNDDGDVIVYGEGVPAALGLPEALACVAINGPFAWELLSRIEGADAAAFPYLSFYRPREGSIYFRAGKTGEFGYDLFVPLEEVEAFAARALELGRDLEVERASVEALQLASLENGFFTLAREGRRGLTPFELQLQWRLSSKKRAFTMGTRRITYFSSEESIRAGDAVCFREEKIGEVLVAERSPILERQIGIALLDLRWAHSGIEAFATERGVSIRTESAPLVNNLSTFLKPGRDAFARRDEIAFPGWKRGREREAS